MLKLSLKHRADIDQAAIAAYPLECCGILLGEVVESGPAPLKRVTQVWPTKNSWTPEIEAEIKDQALGEQDFKDQDPKDHNSKEHSQGDRFWIDPRELLQAQKFARSQHWNIVGIYHSHPDHPAVPSERDRLFAWSEYSYLIVSVEEGAIADCQSWFLNEQRQFQNESIQLAQFT